MEPTNSINLEDVMKEEIDHHVYTSADSIPLTSVVLKPSVKEEPQLIISSSTSLTKDQWDKDNIKRENADDIVVDKCETETRVLEERIECKEEDLDLFAKYEDVESKEEYERSVVSYKDYQYKEAVNMFVSPNAERCKEEELTMFMPDKYHQFTVENPQITCKSKLAILRHMRQVHSNEKPLICNECEYSCKYKSDLKNHKLVHSTDKPFKCDECEYSSRRKRDLRMHKQVHSAAMITQSPSKQDGTDKIKKRRYQCTECSASFPLKRNLTRHMKMHTNKVDTDG